MIRKPLFELTQFKQCWNQHFNGAQQFSLHRKIFGLLLYSLYFTLHWNMLLPMNMQIKCLLWWNGFTY